MSYDLTKLVGFNFNGLEVSSVDIATAQNAGGVYDYVPGSTTYNVLPADFNSNNSDTGFSETNTFEQVTAASNGTQIDGTPLANPLALGQIVYNDVVNGAPSPSVTYDVLGVSSDGTSLLVASASAYNANAGTNPYSGQYNIISDTNIDGNATPSLFPSTVQTFTTTNTYIGGPVASGGVAADLVTVTNALAGLTLPANVIVNTTSGSGGVVQNADGSYTVLQTSAALAVGSGKVTAQTTGGTGIEGQATLKFAAAGGTVYFQVVGFNTTQILLEGVSATGAALGTPRYYVLSIKNAPAQSANVNITFENFGTAPISGQAFPCFMAGTRIATPDGERDVETLVAGDMLLDVDGAAHAIRWVGRRTVATLFADPLRGLPVRIRAGALAEGLPKRDLLVSPDHAMFVAGCLVQAGALVNGTTIVHETALPASFTYYHLELDAHRLVLAEGAATETFVDNVDRMVFDNWDEHQAADGVEMVELPYARAKSARQVPGAVRTLIADRVAALTGVASIAA